MNTQTITQGRYVKLCLKYKAEHDMTGGKIVVHKNKHFATSATINNAIRLLFSLLQRRAVAGKVWRAQMYLHPGNTLLLDWKENEPLIKPQYHAQTA